MNEHKIKTKLVVLGGGPGGYPAAFFAADLGMDVVLVDPDENPGGVCLNRGCIPSKALLHTAGVIREAKEASAFGVEFKAPKIDLDKVRAFAQQVVSSLTSGLGQLARARKVNHVRGMGKLKDAHTLLIDPVADGPTEIEFDHLIVATGSSPNHLPHAPASEKIWDSDRALLLPEIPKKLLIVGGGYIGLELGSVYAALGSAVSVAEMTGSLLPGADADLARPLRKSLNGLFTEIMVDTKVTAFVENAKGIEVTLASALGTPAFPPRQEQFDACLIAVGRRPNSQGIGLESAGIVVDGRGFIQVDACMRTTCPNIFAIGDIAGPPMLAHTATHQGRTAVEVIAGKNVVYAPRAYPAVVFTHPEIAWCGITERQAAVEGLEVTVLKFPHAASGRAKTMGYQDGLTKLIADPQSGQILGAGIVGPNAGELIGEIVFAIEMGATVIDLSLTIHPHPTLSETIMEAAELFSGHCTHFVGGPRKKR